MLLDVFILACVEVKCVYFAAALIVILNGMMT